MTLHLLSSFQTHRGRRGCHFYNDDDCAFLDWLKVLKFIENLPEDTAFADKLASTLANYNPDTEFLAVQQNEGQVSVELYSNISG